MYWKVCSLCSVAREMCLKVLLQLTRNDASRKTLNRAALGLAIYGGLILVFW